MKPITNAVWAYLKTGYAIPFRVFSFFMGHFITNRNRLKAFMAQPRVATTFTIAIGLTMVVWIGIGLYASDADRGRLTSTVMELWDDTKALNDQKKQMNQQAEGAAQ